MNDNNLNKIIEKLKNELSSDKVPIKIRRQKEIKLRRLESILDVYFVKGVYSIGIIDNEIFIGNIFYNSFGEKVSFLNKSVGHTWEIAQGIIHEKREKECLFDPFTKDWFSYVYKPVDISNEEFINAYEMYFDNNINLVYIPKKKIHVDLLKGLGFEKKGNKYTKDGFDLIYNESNWESGGKEFLYMEDLPL